MELADDLARALKSAALEGERSDGTLVLLAHKSRMLPSEVVDEAFPKALSAAIAEIGAQPSRLAEILIAAEQFADRAGADRFLEKTQTFVKSLLGPGQNQLIDAQETSFEGLQIRARLIALLRATGAPVSLNILNREIGLQSRQPLLWLDLAIKELPSITFVDKAKEFINRDAFHPFALVPRLKLILQQHGAGTAQAILDAACRKLYSRRRYSEAATLVARANLVAPQGWRLPFGGSQIFLPIPASNINECIQAFLTALRQGIGEPVQIVRLFRDMLDPLLAFGSEEEEEGRRAALRRMIFDTLPSMPGYERLRLTGLLPDFRLEDSVGFDWWQDNELWSRNLPPLQKFTALARTQASVRALWWKQETLADISDSADPSTIKPTSEFRANQLADSMGFGSSSHVAP